jgi:hypothetical protein
MSASDFGFVCARCGIGDGCSCLKLEKVSLGVCLAYDWFVVRKVRPILSPICMNISICIFAFHLRIP